MKAKFMCIAEVVTKQIHFFKSTVGYKKAKGMSLCNKFQFSNTYISTTKLCKP